MSATAGDGRFHTTRWSVVLRAGGRSAAAGGAAEGPAREDAAEALARLAATYWFPLYAYARRRGLDRDDARDHTQGFFALLLERDDIARATPERGRFRSFLLTAFQHYLANEAERARAAKRGGGRAPLSIDARDADSRLALEPADPETPEKAFERAWARALLARTIESLRTNYAARGKAELFDALREHLIGGAEGTPYAELAQRLGHGEGALRVAVHRLRARYRAELRREVADTVADAGDVEDELRRLFDALG
jgi:RNA polymerase sigma-70 factor (ECF subfamily)